MLTGAGAAAVVLAAAVTRKCEVCGLASNGKSHGPQNCGINRKGSR